MRILISDLLSLNLLACFAFLWVFVFAYICSCRSRRLAFAWINPFILLLARIRPLLRSSVCSRWRSSRWLCSCWWFSCRLSSCWLCSCWLCSCRLSSCWLSSGRRNTLTNLLSIHSYIGWWSRCSTSTTTSPWFFLFLPSLIPLFKALLRRHDNCLCLRLIVLHSFLFNFFYRLLEFVSKYSLQIVHSIFIGIYLGVQFCQHTWGVKLIGELGLSILDRSCFIHIFLRSVHHLDHFAYRFKFKFTTD